MDENLSKEKLLENQVRQMHRKFLSCIYMILMVINVLYHPEKMAKSSVPVLLKWLISMKKNLSKNPGHYQFIYFIDYYQYN